MFIYILPDEVIFFNIRVTISIMLHQYNINATYIFLFGIPIKTVTTIFLP